MTTGKHTPGPKHAEWAMPQWMEPFRPFITNTGGNPIEELMNDHDTTTDTNVVRALICVAVKSQVGMLMRAYADGKLPAALLAERDALKADLVAIKSILDGGSANGRILSDTDRLVRAYALVNAAIERAS